MLNRFWQANLKITLQRLSKPEQPVRLAVVGIGHELGGDDAVGMRVAGLLKQAAGCSECLLALEAGPAPENFTGKLRSFRPDLVLLVDAAFMDCEPGTVMWLDWQDANGFSASTHTLPLNILAFYLTQELGCEVALLGIQPRQTLTDTPLTPELQQAAQQVASLLVEIVS